MTARSEDNRGVQIPLRTAMVLGLGGLMLLAVAVALWLGYRGTRETTVELMSDSAETILNSTVHVFERELDPVVDQALWIADGFASGLVDFSDLDRLDMFIRGALAATPELSGLALFTPDYQERLYKRGIDRAVLVDRSSDEEFKQWFGGFQNLRGPSWGAPVWVDDLRETVINLRTPLFRDGRFLGVLIQGVSVADLSRALSTDNAGDDFVQFVLYDRTWILAHPAMTDPRKAYSDAEPLPDMAGFEDGVLRNIWSRDRTPLAFIHPDTGIQGSTVTVGDHPYVFLYWELNRYADKPLILGIYFDRELMGETVQMTRLRRVLYAGTAIIVLSVIAALLVGRAIGHPILRLSDAAETIKGGNLDRFEPLPRTAFREITDASLSFNAMVEGLKERNLVRGLLGKYVPEGVAKNLIKDRGAIEPISTEATIMFTDIAGFTTISESITPEKMVEMLNDYFTVLAQILEDHGGVIAQFQGDGLIAMFNVPVAHPDHAAEAVRSALEIQKAVDARPFAGHALSCRIGLATGQVVAGSVGASDRLTFTVYGDTVNLASRLEQMNKEHGTRILVHERTAELAGDFPFESIGMVTVRGKAESVTVYTVR